MFLNQPKRCRNPGAEAGDPGPQREFSGPLSTRRRNGSGELDALEAKAKSAATSDLTALGAELARLRREALLANPLLDFDRLLLVKRNAAHLALPQNWESNSSIPRRGIENEIVVLRGLRGNPVLEKLYQPGGKTLRRRPGAAFRRHAVHVFLHRHQRPLGRVRDEHERRQLRANCRSSPMPTWTTTPPATCPTTASSSPPPRRSSACRACAGSSHVAHLYRYWPATGKIRRLTFDQEHNWCPTVMPDGRLLYLRWEYSDLPHFVARILFTMNPDGTNQREFYGSGSYWPNAFFYAKPMPGSPNKVVGIVGGHHGVPRMGELVIIDPSLGRFEADGVVQRIPGRGKKVEPIILDNLVDNSWPKFLHPVPLSDKYVIAACKPTAASLWGIYLVDVFDNMTLIKEEPGFALLEPVPLQAAPRPPVIPDTVKEGEQDRPDADRGHLPGAGPAGRAARHDQEAAPVHLQFLLPGHRRAGGPRGSGRAVGHQAHHRHGAGGSGWLGQLRGAGQPAHLAAAAGRKGTGRGADAQLDHRHAGRSPILRRLPREAEQRLHASRPTAWPCASRRRRSRRSTGRCAGSISIARCSRCWIGIASPATTAKPAPTGRAIPDFRRGPLVFAGEREVKFPPAYVALKAYVRNPTAENDMHLLLPYEFHASTTELVQLLEAGHHGVKLDAEVVGPLEHLDRSQHARLGHLGGNGDAEFGGRRGREADGQTARAPPGTDPALRRASMTTPTRSIPRPTGNRSRRRPSRRKKSPRPPRCEGWPFDAAEARRRQQNGGPATMNLDLGGGVSLTLVRIPAGRFVAGSGTASARVVADPAGLLDERLRNQQRAIRPLQSPPRQPHRARGFSPVQRGAARASAERIEPAGLPRFLGRGAGVLPMAVRAVRPRRSSCPAATPGNTPAAPARPRRWPTAK